ncbi:hypothetical protein [Maritalea sp.]|uniref:hypothetical protein n=1 Tax=Maritalea sp. TaxID=2003361 RepID=UPI0039E33BB8
MRRGAASAGEAGIAISLVSTEELSLLGDVQRMLNITIPATDAAGEPVELNVPSTSGKKTSYRRGGGGGGQRRPRGSDGNHRKGGAGRPNSGKPEGRGGERSEVKRGDKPFARKPKRDDRGGQKRSGPPGGKRRSGGEGGGNRSRGPKVA